MQEEHNVDMELLLGEWKTARTNRENYTKDFPSLDSIVDAIPINYENGAPYVGDTTLAGLVRAIPRSSLQQLPTFAVHINGTKNSINAQIGSYILRRGVFNQDTFGKGLLSTMQLGGEQALTHGYAPFFTATGSMFDDFGTTMRLLHYADCDPEPGIQDANEGGYFYIIANLTKTRVTKIRDLAMENPNTSWLVEPLNRLLEMKPTTSQSYSIYQSDARKQNGQEAPTYEFVTRYEVGKQGKFITFCPQIEDSPLRVLKNRSKFGYPRVQFLVIDPAPLTPFGLSRVRLASPNQNLMNAYYMNVASMFILNSKPPVLQRGRFTTPVELKQGAKWIAVDQNATAELVEMSNGSLQQFVPMAQQMSAQIQNIMGSPRGTVNGNSNAMGYSKTAPGVKMQQAESDLSTNQVTNIMENFLRQYALVGLDTLISEQTTDPEIDPNTGEPIPTEDETIILDDEAKANINRIQPDTVGDDNTILVNWNDFYAGVKTWGVEIELSIGKDELEEKQRADIQDTVTVLLQNADKLSPEMQQTASELLKLLTEKAVPQSAAWKPKPVAPAGMLPEEVPPAPMV